MRNEQNEEWRAVPGWPEYEVSSIGHVRRVAVYHTTRVGRMLNLHTGSTGYLRAALSRSSKTKYELVHRLVAMAFLPAPSEGQTEVAHRNGVRTDNSVGNLRWDSAKGNASDRWEHGTYRTGEEHFAAKVTWEIAQKVREFRQSGMTLRQLAEHFGLSKTTVAGIVRNERWSEPGPQGQADRKSLERNHESVGA